MTLKHSMYHVDTFIKCKKNIADLPAFLFKGQPEFTVATSKIKDFLVLIYTLL